MEQKYIDRFFQRTRKTDNCWLWTAGTFHHSKPYGYLWVKNKFIATHRLSWEIHNGPIPKGLMVCHTCDNPICVNPAHLFLGTNGQNTADKVKKGRQARGEKQGSAKLTEADIWRIREAYRLRLFLAKELALVFKVSPNHIQQIVDRKMWKHVP
jgi:hypothetical protein